jgi:hypothetical protein
MIIKLKNFLAVFALVLMNCAAQCLLVQNNLAAH